MSGLTSVHLQRLADLCRDHVDLAGVLHEHRLSTLMAPPLHRLLKHLPKGEDAGGSSDQALPAAGCINSEAFLWPFAAFSLPFLDLSLPFHCLSLTFRCLSLIDRTHEHVGARANPLARAARAERSLNTRGTIGTEETINPV